MGDPKEPSGQCAALWRVPVNAADGLAEGCCRQILGIMHVVDVVVEVAVNGIRML